MNTMLTYELQKAREFIEGHARAYGLDFFDTVFELVDFEQMNMVAAYGGFPTRYPHWRFGMEYEQLSKAYAYGLQKIYELVINNDPSYAYLLNANHLVDQKLVMAHVFGHVDFFKNNAWFAHTSRKMMDEMANHGSRIRRYIQRHGEDTVEAWLDVCLSLDNLIDQHAPFIQRRDKRGTPVTEETNDPQAAYRMKSKPYMEHFINPRTFLDEMVQRDHDKQEEQERTRRFPDRPERDVLWFLLNYAPMAAWQADVLAIVRDEAYYFAPQGQTKIMNEGWASFWHTTIMTQKALDASEIVDYADHHSGTVAVQPGRLNPYKLGLDLLRDVEDRWNKGRFGKEWEECDDPIEKRRWDRDLGLGRQKVFEVRRVHNDITFIDEFLTADFCRHHKLFHFKLNPNSNQYQISDREFKQIKHQLLSSLTNFGQPFITVVDGNYGNRGELYLQHRHEGQDLRPNYVPDTLKNLHAVWRRPVNLETADDGLGKVIRYDGHDYTEMSL
ncbi:MAG: SpoVR family protein [Candidatus Sericytochromatia bacterium]|nr:SpoVR family protein [Candidatus Sericytochromatia bacterium]